MPIFHCGLNRQAKKATGSENKKIAPSQTRHKNATEAGQFDREVAEANHGGVAPNRHLFKFKDSASCAPSVRAQHRAACKTALPIDHSLSNGASCSG